MSDMQGTFGRRGVLTLLGGMAGAAGVAGTASARTDQYSTVVNVAEAGADPTGQEPIDDVIESALDDDTLIEFPSGTYKIEQVNLYGHSNLTLRGSDDDVTLLADDDHGEAYWIGGADTRNLTFENFTLDHTAAGAAPSIEFGSYDGLVVRDIEKRGSQDGDATALGLRAYSASATTLVENVAFPDGGQARGGVGIWVDGDGETILRDCRVEGFGNNGLYASYSKGPVGVEGGTYKDNDRAQVRLGSDGSYVEGANIVVEDPSGDDPCTGVRISNGLGPVTVSNCDVSMTAGRGSGGVMCADNGGSFTVENSRIYIGPDYTANESGGTRTAPGIFVDEAPAADLDHDVVGTAVTGGGDYYPSIFAKRDGVRVRDCCVDWDGPAGIGFEDTTGNAVRNTNVTVDGSTVEGEADVSGVTTGEACPRPDLGGGADDSTASNDSTGLADVPLPANASRMTYPTMGTDESNPTLTVYGNFVYPNTREFVFGNLREIIDEYVVTGKLNVEFRSVAYPDDHRLNSVAGEERLAQLALGVWDKNNWENYWGVFEYLFENQGDVEWDAWTEAEQLLGDAGVERVTGWIPLLVANDEYADEVSESRARAGNTELEYVPQVSLNGDCAGANWDTDALLAWIEERR